MPLNKHRDAPEDNSSAVIVWVVVAALAWIVLVVVGIVLIY